VTSRYPASHLSDFAGRLTRAGGRRGFCARAAKGQSVVAGDVQTTPNFTQLLDEVAPLQIGL
jgi:hypothetical protein